MLNVAVLDDYQNVTKKFGNWSELDGKINLKIFNKFFDYSDDLVKCLLDFEVLCLMRERTVLSASIINKLPKLKLVITTGMWNPSVDTNALKKREIIFWFLAAMISFSSSNKILREEKRESIEVTGRVCIFFVCNL